MKNRGKSRYEARINDRMCKIKLVSIYDQREIERQ